MRALRFDMDMIEAVKWFAAFLMLLEHINRYVLAEPSAIFYFLGRMAYPLFAVALGVTMAGRDQSSMSRAFKRTLMWALLAQFTSGLVRDPAPWNILFVMAAGLLIVSQIERRTWLALASCGFVLLVCPFAEFSVAGVFMAVAGITFGRHQNALSAAFLVFAVSFLHVENGNWFAMGALPVLCVFALMRWEVPRIRNALQIFYAGHFALLAAAAAVIKGSA